MMWGLRVKGAMYAWWARVVRRGESAHRGTDGVPVRRWAGALAAYLRRAFGLGAEQTVVVCIDPPGWDTPGTKVRYRVTRDGRFDLEYVEQIEPMGVTDAKSRHPSRRQKGDGA